MDFSRARSVFIPVSSYPTSRVDRHADDGEGRMDVNAACLDWILDRARQERREMHSIRAAMCLALLVDRFAAMSIPSMPPKLATKMICWYTCNAPPTCANNHWRRWTEQPRSTFVVLVTCLVRLRSTPRRIKCTPGDASIRTAIVVATMTFVLAMLPARRWRIHHAPALELERFESYTNDMLAQLCGLELHLLPPIPINSAPYHCRILHLRLNSPPSQ